MLALSASTVKTLTSATCASLQIAHANGWGDILKNGRKRASWEPQMVAHLCAGMAGVAAAWRGTLGSIHPGIRLDLTSVFTHQTPKVDYYPKSGGTKTCELADLLFAVIDRRKSAKSFGTGVAALVQAKLSDSCAVTLTKTEKTQFDLLARRDPFDVLSSGVAPLNVDLAAYTPDKSLLYGLAPPDKVTPPLTSGHLWTTKDQLSSVTPYTVSASKCMAETLVDLLQSKCGSGFTLSPTTPPGWSYFSSVGHRDDWSMLINYLLEHTFGLPLIQLSHAGRTPVRGTHHAIFMNGRSPQMNPAFFLFDGDPKAPRDLNQARKRVPEGFWPLGSSDSGDGGSHSPLLVNDQFSGGPISVIVFEIGDLFEG